MVSFDFSGLLVYGSILGAVIIFIILAWIFELFNKKKISDFFEKIAYAIHDFFT